MLPQSRTKGLSLLLFFLTTTGVFGWWFSLQMLSEHESIWNLLFNAVYAIPYFLAGITLIQKGRRSLKQKEFDGKSLLFIGIACLSYMSAQAIWAITGIFGDSVNPIASLADFFYVASVCFQVVGLWCLLMHKKDEREGTAHFFVPFFFSLFLPFIFLLFLSHFPETTSAFILNIFYIFASILICLLVLANTYRESHGALRPFFLLLLLANVTSGVGDVLFAFFNFQGTYWNGDVSDGFYALAALFFYVAAVQAPAFFDHVDDHVEQRFRLLRLHVVFPVLFALFGVLLSLRFGSYIYFYEYDRLVERLNTEIERTSAEIRYHTHFFSTFSDLISIFSHSVFLASLETNQGALLWDGHEGKMNVGVLSEENLDSTSFAFLQQAEIRFEDEKGDWVLKIAPNKTEAAIPFQHGLIAFLFSEIIIITLAWLVSLVLLQQGRLRHRYRLQSYELEHRLLELEERRLYLDRVHDLVFACKNDGRISYANQASAALFAAKVDQLIGTAFFPFLFSSATVQEEVRQELAKKGQWQGEVVFEKGTGEKQEYEFVIQNLDRENQVSFGLLAVGHNVTRLKEMQRLKNQFVSLVAHQLRAPMAQLRWMSEALLERPRLPKTLQEPLRSLNAIVLKENKLVSDLLNISRIERGVLAITLESIPVLDLLDEVVEPLKPLARAQHVFLRLPKRQKNLSLKGDRQKLVEALRNLVDNAIKYTHPKTSVQFGFEKQGAFGLLSLSDAGPGIPEELWGTLFEVKTSVSDSQSAGFGLYLTKKFIDAMGGELTFKTSSSGTTFFIRLPLAE